MKVSDTFKQFVEAASTVTAVITVIQAIVLSFKVAPREPPRYFPRPSVKQVQSAQTDEVYRDYIAVINTDFRDQYDEGLAQFTRLIEDAPSFAYAYYCRGLIYLHLNRVRQGIADMKTVLTLSEDPKLQQKAKKEVWMVRAAMLLVPLHFGAIAVGIISALALSITEDVQKRRFATALAISMGMYFATLIFLAVH